MKKIKYLLLFAKIMFLLALSTSCEQSKLLLLKATGHIKTPKPENPETILLYAQKNNFYYDYLYMPVSDSAIIDIMTKGYFALGGVLPYDKYKNPIIVKPNKDSSECPHYTSSNFQSQDTAIAFVVADTLDFWDRLSMMKLIDKREDLPYLSDSIPDYDYFVIGMWCPMLPKLSKNVHLDFLDAIAIDPTKRVCIISFNYSPRSGNKFYKDLKKMAKQTKKENKRAQK
ncbi:MAG: hypothetical protein FWH18_04760 [Marinilabiliaceae bacterium]|nr:hypothetical protein [Marinilabiliaceae bacterium]